jgi:hypothetical protein
MPKGKRKERKLPKAGTKFIRKFKEKEYTLIVVEDDGKIKYMVEEKLFNSPTSAAQSLVDKSMMLMVGFFGG